MFNWKIGHQNQTLWLVLFSGRGLGGSLSSNSTSCSISLSHFKNPQHSTVLHLLLYKIFIIANISPMLDVTSRLRNTSDNSCMPLRRFFTL